MGLIAKLLSFVRTETDEGAYISDATIDPGGGANITAQHFGPPGDDSHPLPDDYVACVPSGGSGTESAVGYIDTANEPQAEAGEKRIYSRNADGEIVAEVWLKNDGEVLVRSIEGDVSVRVLPDGNVHLAGNAAKLSRDDRTNAELNRIWTLLRTWSVAANDGGAALQLAANSAYTADGPPDTGADNVHGT